MGEGPPQVGPRLKPTLVLSAGEKAGPRRGGETHRDRGTRVAACRGGETCVHHGVHNEPPIQHTGPPRGDDLRDRGASRLRRLPTSKLRALHGKKKNRSRSWNSSRFVYCNGKRLFLVCVCLRGERINHKSTSGSCRSAHQHLNTVVWNRITSSLNTHRLNTNTVFNPLYSVYRVYRITH